MSQEQQGRRLWRRLKSRKRHIGSRLDGKCHDPVTAGAHNRDPVTPPECLYGTHHLIKGRLRRHRAGPGSFRFFPFASWGGGHTCSHTPPSRNRVEFDGVRDENARGVAMPSAKRVLLVDDDTTLRSSLAEQLAAEG